MFKFSIRNHAKCQSRRKVKQRKNRGGLDVVRGSFKMDFKPGALVISRMMAVFSGVMW